jgi:hypothetical protein
MAVMRTAEMDRARHAWPAAAIGKFPSREIGPPHGTSPPWPKGFVYWLSA